MRRSLLSYCSPYVRWLESQQEKLEHVLEVLAGVKTIESTAGEQLSEAHPDAGKVSTPYGLSSEQQRMELEKRASEAHNAAMRHGIEFAAKEAFEKYHKEAESASPEQSSPENSGHRGA